MPGLQYRVGKRWFDGGFKETGVRSKRSNDDQDADFHDEYQAGPYHRYELSPCSGYAGDSGRCSAPTYSDSQGRSLRWLFGIPGSPTVWTQLRLLEVRYLCAVRTETPSKAGIYEPTDCVSGAKKGWWRERGLVVRVGGSLLAGLFGRLFGTLLRGFNGIFHQFLIRGEEDVGRSSLRFLL